MLEDVAPPREQLRTPYDVHATGFPPDPRRSQFAGVGLYTPVFGSKQSCWAIRVGVGSCTLGLGSRRRGCLYTSAFGSMLVRRRWKMGVVSRVW
jgi:hypothetical protein